MRHEAVHSIREGMDPFIDQYIQLDQWARPWRMQKMRPK